MNTKDPLHALKKVQRADPPADLRKKILLSISQQKYDDAGSTFKWSFAAAAMMLLCLNVGIWLKAGHEQPVTGNDIQTLARGLELSTSNEFSYE